MGCSRASSLSTNRSDEDDAANAADVVDADPAPHARPADPSPTKGRRGFVSSSNNGKQNGRGYRNAIHDGDEDYGDDRVRGRYPISGTAVKGTASRRANSFNSASPEKAPVRRKSQKPPAAASSAPAPAPAPSNGGGRRSLFAPKPRDDLVQCSNCGRNFADDRIDKHRDICVKTSKKKRKVYDSTKHRVEGTGAESFVKKGRRTGGKTAASSSTSASNNAPKKGDWRKKREEFIQALRAAKQAQRHVAAGGKLSDLPPPPPMDTSDYVPCPHCGRKFNEAAAERHIPKCKNIKSNKR